MRLDEPSPGQYSGFAMTASIPIPSRTAVCRVLAAVLLLCLVSTGWVKPCIAAGDQAWSRYNKWEIKAFDVVGVPDAMSAELKNGLALSGQWKLLTGRQRPDFSAQTLAEDLQRIRVFLAQRGYPGALVVPEAEPHPDSRELDLRITVTPGEPVRVGELRFDGWPAELPVPAAGSSGFLSEGDIFTDAAVAAGVRAVRAYLLNAGYAKATVSFTVLPLGPARVVVAFTITAGEFYRIHTVTVSGCSEDLVALSHRIIDIDPGTEYSETRVADAVRDLRLTQLFRQVGVSVEPAGPGLLDLTAQLENGYMRSWDAAVGTWLDNPWMVRSSWVNRNFFHGGRGLRANGEFATHEMSAGVGIFWLGWLSPRARTSLGADVLARREDAYDSRELRAELVQSLRPGNRDLQNFGVALSQNEITGTVPAAGDGPEPQGWLLEFWTDRKWDRTNDPIFPDQGWFLKTSLTFAEPWLISEVPYVSVQSDAARYEPVPLGMVISGRVRVGLAEPLHGASEVLANRRFYAGGYNSHRGYARHGLGPRDSADQSLGGEAVVLLSGELRFPLVWKFEGGIFADGGNVWASLGDVSAAEFPVAIGATIGVRTPLGPLRVGYAFNVADLVSGKPGELWHFGIGYPW